MAGHITSTGSKSWLKDLILVLILIRSGEAINMSQSLITPSEMYGKLADTLLIQPEVTQLKKKGFGSGLRIQNKVFAMLVSGKLIVKLPKERVEILILSGEGERYDHGHGRLMKEWLIVESSSLENWMHLVKEAMEYVGR
jgi:hypothetical protein